MTLLDTRQSSSPATHFEAGGSDEQQSSGAPVNVGTAERWASAIGGGAMAVAGLRARSLPGLLLAGLGGALIYRGASGHCPAYAAAGFDTARHDGAKPEEY